MPWTAHYYPASMKHLADAARDEAIEIANALLDEGLDEGAAIRIAIAQANAWTRRHAIEGELA